MSVNKWIGIGNVGKIETRFMTNGEAVTSISIACNETWKDKAGEKHEKCEWVNLVMYKKLAEIAEKYVVVGQQIYVEGKLQTRKWQAKDGTDRYSTEVVCHEMQMLGSKKDESVKPSPRPQVEQAKGGFDDFPSDEPF